MNKIINKALFYKEWINIRWVTLITIIILLYFKVYGVISQLNQNEMFSKQQGGIWNDRWFNNGLYVNSNYFVVMVFIVIILSIILFLGEKTSETQGFIASMPFTRKEIILNKWLVGVLSILISFVVTYILLSIVYAANINSINIVLNPYSDIVKWFFIDMFEYICIFTFMVLMQSVMGNSIASGIVGAIILAVPWFISVIVFSMIMQVSFYSSSALAKLVGWLNIYSYNSIYGEYFNIDTKSGNISYNIFNYNDYTLKLLILLIVTCLFLYLAYISYKKRNLEYNLNLIAFRKLQPVFICGVTVCSGLLGGALGGYSNGILSRTFWPWSVVLGIIGYFISKLSIKVFSSGK